MVTIATNSGHQIMVDNDDYPYLSQFIWHVSKTNSNNIYAMRHIVIDGKKTKVYLHREVLGNPKNCLIDHIDQNGLNCQKSNLRKSDKSRNGQNHRPYGQIPYMGVSVHKDRYRTQLFYKGKRYSCVCDTPECAALMYNHFAIQVYGENARLNRIPA